MANSENPTITLYHYTRQKNIALILHPESGLLPSLSINGDAQWGDGQYFTDLTPEESSTLTRHQHSFTLFNMPWQWGGSAPYDEIGWIAFIIALTKVRREATLFGSRFPHRSIYRYPNTEILRIEDLFFTSGMVLFQKTPSGHR